MNSTIRTMIHWLRTDHGEAIHQFARAIGYVLAVVYVAGIATGHWVHSLNDQIAGIWPTDEVRSISPTPVTLPVVQRQAAAAAPSGGVQPPALSHLTVRELRRLVQQQGISNINGRRTSKARRTDLIEAIG